MLAVIGAMKEKADLLEAETTVSERRVHAGIEVIRGRFRGTEPVLAQCGIGKVNATICTQMLIDLYRPRALILSGVARRLRCLAPRRNALLTGGTNRPKAHCGETGQYQRPLV